MLAAVEPRDMTEAPEASAGTAMGRGGGRTSALAGSPNLGPPPPPQPSAPSPNSFTALLNLDTSPNSFINSVLGTAAGTAPAPRPAPGSAVSPAASMPSPSLRASSTRHANSQHQSSRQARQGRSQGMTLAPRQSRRPPPIPSSSAASTPYAGTQGQGRASRSSPADGKGRASDVDANVEDDDEGEEDEDDDEDDAGDDDASSPVQTPDDLVPEEPIDWSSFLDPTMMNLAGVPGAPTAATPAVNTGNAAAAAAQANSNDALAPMLSANSFTATTPTLAQQPSAPTPSGDVQAELITKLTQMIGDPNFVALMGGSNGGQTPQGNAPTPSQKLDLMHHYASLVTSMAAKLQGLPVPQDTNSFSESQAVALLEALLAKSSGNGSGTSQQQLQANSSAQQPGYAPQSQAVASTAPGMPFSLFDFAGDDDDDDDNDPDYFDPKFTQEDWNRAIVEQFGSSPAAGNGSGMQMFGGPSTHSSSFNHQAGASSSTAPPLRQLRTSPRKLAQQHRSGSASNFGHFAGHRLSPVPSSGGIWDELTPGGATGRTPQQQQQKAGEGRTPQDGAGPSGSNRGGGSGAFDAPLRPTNRQYASSTTAPSPADVGTSYARAHSSVRGYSPDRHEDEDQRYGGSSPKARRTDAGQGVSSSTAQGKTAESRRGRPALGEEERLRRKRARDLERVKRIRAEDRALRDEERRIRQAEERALAAIEAGNAAAEGSATLSAQAEAARRRREAKEKERSKEPKMTPAQMKAENRMLRLEIERLRDENARMRVRLMRFEEDLEGAEGGGGAIVARGEGGRKRKREPDRRSTKIGVSRTSLGTSNVKSSSRTSGAQARRSLTFRSPSMESLDSLDRRGRGEEDGDDDDAVSRLSHDSLDDEEDEDSELSSDASEDEDRTLYVDSKSRRSSGRGSGRYASRGRAGGNGTYSDQDDGAAAHHLQDRGLVGKTKRSSRRSATGVGRVSASSPPPPPCAGSGLKRSRTSLNDGSGGGGGGVTQSRRSMSPTTEFRASNAISGVGGGSRGRATLRAEQEAKVRRMALELGII